MIRTTKFLQKYVFIYIYIHSYVDVFRDELGSASNEKENLCMPPELQGSRKTINSPKDKEEEEAMHGKSGITMRRRARGSILKVPSFQMNASNCNCINCDRIIPHSASTGVFGRSSCTFPFNFGVL